MYSKEYELGQLEILLHDSVILLDLYGAQNQVTPVEQIGASSLEKITIDSWDGYVKIPQTKFMSKCVSFTY